MNTLALADRYARQTVDALLAASTRDGGAAWVSIVRERMISFALDLALPDATDNLSAGQKTKPKPERKDINEKSTRRFPRPTRRAGEIPPQSRLQPGERPARRQAARKKARKKAAGSRNRAKPQ